METSPHEPAFPMTARSALLYLLRTHDEAVHGDPARVLEMAERHLSSCPDDAEVRAHYQCLRDRGMRRC
jgi:hypothetical protein